MSKLCCSSWYSCCLVTWGESGDKPQEKLEFSQDVVDALELLLQYTPLLDIMDAKCSCNCIECLLKELLRNGLVTESHVTHFTSKRCVLPPALTFQDEKDCIITCFSVCQFLMGLTNYYSACHVVWWNELRFILSTVESPCIHKDFPWVNGYQDAHLVCWYWQILRKQTLWTEKL